MDGHLPCEASRQPRPCHVPAGAGDDEVDVVILGPAADISGPTLDEDEPFGGRSARAFLETSRLWAFAGFPRWQHPREPEHSQGAGVNEPMDQREARIEQLCVCLLYTSDAADD